MDSISFKETKLNRGQEKSFKKGSKQKILKENIKKGFTSKGETLANKFYLLNTCIIFPLL